jgi:cytochrome c oxidase subunit 2
LSPTNIFAPASTPANTIFGLSLFVLAVTAAIFVTVFTLLVYAVVRYRRKGSNDGVEPRRFMEAIRWSWLGQSSPS